MSEHDRAATADDIAEHFHEDCVRFQSAFVEFVAEHLTDVSRAVRGDLQLPLILAFLGQRVLLWQAEADRAREAGPPAWRPTMAATRIADVTGIPRETVRRKLADLEARGWIERDTGGKLGIGRGGGRTPAREALADLDHGTVTRAARFYATLRDLM